MSTELLLDSSIPIIKLNKPILTFRINTNSINNQKNNSSEDLILIGECEINVTNITSNNVALRVRTTKKKLYTVEPNFCTLLPNSAIKIIISAYSHRNDEINSKGHKFRFEGIIIPKNLIGSDTKEIFAELTKNQRQVKGNSIKRVVEFITDNSPPQNDIDITKSIDNIQNENNLSMSQSIYSVALQKSGERPVRISLKSRNKDNDINNINMNIETPSPNNLKEDCEKLQKENEKFNKELEDIKSKLNVIDFENKYKNSDQKTSKISAKFLGIILLVSIFIGFYLTK